ncbi:putative amino acid dehydrogenase [Deinococcus metalli]|uniref:Putative amino acid dehydrogenase n=1 Tax=Deinococcus metalli TaxID=1141878 RepID=A0A7W8NNL2_9DEIO|nr:semialdehyde dehydrogenase [Deinococcus metalli]MBB5374825.1 putative amino acid dehydrogenase [Deinococcus metalli]GHF33426.1 hypothetical protein GCM10017781_07730 [Deinococcus metalli]
MTTEPHSSPAYRPRHPVAFVTCPGTDHAGDLGRPSTALGGVLGAWLRRLPLRARVTGPLRAADNPERPAGWVITLPVTPDEVCSGSRRARRLLWQALDRARALGALTVGLGGGSAALLGGELPDDVGITTGSAFRAVLCVMTVRRLLAHVPPGTPVAVVGADTGVGRAVVALLADLSPWPLLLVDTPVNDVSAGPGRVSAGPLQVTADLRDVRAAGLVVLLDGAALGADHLGPDALVLDDSQPRVTRPDLLLRRPDVRVVDGGVAAVPGVWRPGAPRGRAARACACLAETLLLGLAGHEGHFTLGPPQSGQAQLMVELAARFGALGFGPAAPRSFGEPVNLTRRFEQDAPRPGTHAGHSAASAARLPFPLAELTP